MRNHPGLMPTNAILYTTLINERILGAEAKLAYAQKHSLAERDLRMRINKQFDNVRSVLPNLIKSLVYSENGGLVKATFSCDDRRELVSDLTRTMELVKGQAVRAEMVVVGGRTKGEVWVKGVGGNEEIQVVKRALQMVVDGPGSYENKKMHYFAH
ncbi:hypothetical protein SLEP1_g33217 [Rubroshorea leprosula]|uniref:Uncharacterized protein n=1 Tax=Rubroshorea leprosula TaxID=152421 RepID=A0AAV5KFZ9_9ROSI|nr:hypothetical protein SLEP1_g33217 [Rubroshorea leprosula]